MHLRIIILEDTPSEFMQTKHALEQYADLYHHTFEIVWVQNESSLIRMYHAQSFDLLFADIEIKLPNASSSENGIIICKKLRELQYSGDIIFLTNFQEYVFDGYSVRAFNYLLKPITLEVLTPCMDAYLQLHSDDYYYYQNDQTYIRIPYTNIISISKEKNNTLIVTTDNIYIERISLDEIMNKLSSNFVRCHKSPIIHGSQLAEAIFRLFVPICQDSCKNKVLSPNNISLSYDSISTSDQSHNQANEIWNPKRGCKHLILRIQTVRIIPARHRISMHQKSISIVRCQHQNKCDHTHHCCTVHIQR